MCRSLHNFCFQFRSEIPLFSQNSRFEIPRFSRNSRFEIPRPFQNNKRRIWEFIVCTFAGDIDDGKQLCILTLLSPHVPLRFFFTLQLGTPTYSFQSPCTLQVFLHPFVLKLMSSVPNCFYGRHPFLFDLR